MAIDADVSCQTHFTDYKDTHTIIFSGYFRTRCNNSCFLLVFMGVTNSCKHLWLTHINVSLYVPITESKQKVRGLFSKSLSHCTLSTCCTSVVQWLYFTLPSFIRKFFFGTNLSKSHTLLTNGLRNGARILSPGWTRHKVAGPVKPGAATECLLKE